jgi:hypothetical protein
MQITHDDDGNPHITAYERGDFVRLTRSERGDGLVGRVGDWGRVEDVTGAGLLTIRVAGFSRPRGAAVARLTAVPARLVEPCDRRGTPAPPRGFVVRKSATAAAVRRRASPLGWRAWAAMIAVASSCALLVVAGAPTGPR